MNWLVKRLRQAVGIGNQSGAFRGSPRSQSRHKAATLHSRIIVSPSYDQLTVAMARWLQSAVRSGGATRLVGPRAETMALQAAVQESEHQRILLIFYGHGDHDSLLTAPGLGYSKSRYKGFHSVLCMERDLRSQRSMHILAYACKASREFGVHITNGPVSGAFLGYNDEIPFMVGLPEVEMPFRRPMQQVVESALGKGEIEPECEANLIRWYEAEIGEWLQGTFSQHELAPMVRICLRFHLQYLDFLH